MAAIKDGTGDEKKVVLVDKGYVGKKG